MIIAVAVVTGALRQRRQDLRRRPQGGEQRAQGHHGGAQAAGAQEGEPYVTRRHILLRAYCYYYYRQSTQAIDNYDNFDQTIMDLEASQMEDPVYQYQAPQPANHYGATTEETCSQCFSHSLNL